MTGDQRELALERICLNLIELITDLGRLDELSLVGPRLPAFQDPHAKMRVMMAWQSAWLVAGRVETAVNLLRGLRTHLSSHFPIMVHPESWRDYGKELARSGGAGGGAQLIMEAGQIATALEDIDEDDFAAQVVVTILENAAALQPDDPLSGRADWNGSA